jgi:hypothetical protein
MKTNIYLYELEKQIDENNNPELRRLRLTRDREESSTFVAFSRSFIHLRQRVTIAKDDVPIETSLIMKAFIFR